MNKLLAAALVAVSALAVTSGTITVSSAASMVMPVYVGGAPMLITF